MGSHVAAIANLIQFALHLELITDFAISKIESPPCFKVGMIQRVAALSPHIDPPI